MSGVVQPRRTKLEQIAEIESDQFLIIDSSFQLAREIEDKVGDKLGVKAAGVIYILLGRFEEASARALEPLARWQTRVSVAGITPIRRLLYRMRLLVVEVGKPLGCSPAEQEVAVYPVSVLLLAVLDHGAQVVGGSAAVVRVAGNLRKVRERIRHAVLLNIPASRVELEHRREIGFGRVFDEHIELTVDRREVILAVADPRLAEARIGHAKSGYDSARQHAVKPHAGFVELGDIARVRAERFERKRHIETTTDFNQVLAVLFDDGYFHFICPFYGCVSMAIRRGGILLQRGIYFYGYAISLESVHTN